MAFHRGAEVIQKQILECEQQRLLDAEKREQETQAMLQYLERLQVEDMQSMQKKKETQKKLMEEVAKCNEVCPAPEVPIHTCRALNLRHAWYLQISD